MPRAYYVSDLFNITLVHFDKLLIGLYKRTYNNLFLGDPDNFSKTFRNDRAPPKER